LVAIAVTGATAAAVTGLAGPQRLGHRADAVGDHVVDQEDDGAHPVVHVVDDHEAPQLVNRPDVSA
jgi:hypothetical protein